MEKAEAVVAFVGIDAHIEHCSLKAVGRQGDVQVQYMVNTLGGGLGSRFATLAK